MPPRVGDGERLEREGWGRTTRGTPPGSSRWRSLAAVVSLFLVPTRGAGAGQPTQAGTTGAPPAAVNALAYPGATSCATLGAQCNADDYCVTKDHFCFFDCWVGPCGGCEEKQGHCDYDRESGDSACMCD